MKWYRKLLRMWIYQAPWPPPHWQRGQARGSLIPPSTEVKRPHGGKWTQNNGSERKFWWILVSFMAILKWNTINSWFISRWTFFDFDLNFQKGSFIFCLMIFCDFWINDFKDNFELFLLIIMFVIILKNIVRINSRRKIQSIYSSSDIACGIK